MDLSTEDLEKGWRDLRLLQKYHANGSSDPAASWNRFAHWKKELKKQKRVVTNLPLLLATEERAVSILLSTDSTEEELKEAMDAAACALFNNGEHISTPDRLLKDSVMSPDTECRYHPSAQLRLAIKIRRQSLTEGDPRSSWLQTRDSAAGKEFVKQQLVDRLVFDNSDCGQVPTLADVARYA